VERQNSLMAISIFLELAMNAELGISSPMNRFKTMTSTFRDAVVQSHRTIKCTI